MPTFQEKKDILLELIEELKLSISSEEAKNYLHSITEEDLDSVLNEYEMVKKYQNENDELLGQLDSEKYDKLWRNYKLKLIELDRKHKS